MDPVSDTARWTAAVRALETERGDAILHDPLARALAGAKGFELLARYDTMGVKEFIAIRSRYLDEVIRREVPRVRQIVLLAAGLDTRSVRLAWPEGVSVYELDRPALLAWKDGELAAAGARHACARFAVASDLAGAWQADLRAAGWRPGEPTLWIVEGLLAYLDEEIARGLVRQVAAASAPGSVLAGDVVSQQSLISPLSAETQRKLREDGAPWRFGTDDPEAWLGGSGWRIVETKVAGEDGASFGRWPYPVMPRTMPLVPRTFLFVATPA
jgi:methyltransferase (TIGR00027 family)